MISSTTRVAGPYAGTGSQTAFGFSFKVFQASDVLVVQTDASGNNTTLALTSAYTVALNSNQDTSPGGTVNLVTAAPTGYTITIGSQVQALQGTNLTNAGNFYPTVVNNALDYLTILIQQILVKVSNSLQLPINVTGVSTVLPAPVGGNVVGWNTAGTALQNYNSNQLGSNLAYGQTQALITNGVLGKTAFTLPLSAVTVNNLKVLVGGIGQRPGIDYTLSTDGLTVTFTTAPPAGTNNVCFVWQQALAMGTVPDLGVGTTALQDGAVTTAKHADGSVTAVKMATGAAVGNIGFTPLAPANNLSDVASASTARTNLGAQATLGFTPVNKAGDTMTGGLTVGGILNTGATGQVAFPATQNASSDANTLDDYEEGTWTPVDTSGASLTPTAASGVYTKVGRLVTVVGRFIWPSNSNGLIAKFGGLPFGAAAGFPGFTTHWCTWSQGLNGRQDTPTSFYVTTITGGGPTNAQLAGVEIQFTSTYYTTT